MNFLCFLPEVIYLHIYVYKITCVCLYLTVFVSYYAYILNPVWVTWQ